MTSCCIGRGGGLFWRGSGARAGSHASSACTSASASPAGRPGWLLSCIGRGSGCGGSGCGGGHSSGCGGIGRGIGRSGGLFRCRSRAGASTRASSARSPFAGRRAGRLLSCTWCACRSGGEKGLCHRRRQADFEAAARAAIFGFSPAAWLGELFFERLLWVAGDVLAEVQVIGHSVTRSSVGQRGHLSA